MAAEWLGLRRKVDLGIPIASLVRDPEFAAYLQRPGAGNGIIIRLQSGDPGSPCSLYPPVRSS